MPIVQRNSCIRKVKHLFTIAQKYFIRRVLLAILSRENHSRDSNHAKLPMSEVPLMLKFQIRSFCCRNITLDEFRRAVHEVASQEPLAARFAKLSTSSDRRGMIEMLMEMPGVIGSRPNDSYQGKSDAQAASLYKRLFAATMEPGDNGHATTEIRTRDLLTKALFAASANNRVFLDALCERARRSYSLRAYASCLRDCECMLALPASFYDDSAENVKHFVQRRKECLQLERECSRKMEAASPRKRGASHGKTTSSSSPSSFFSSSSSGVSNSRTSQGKRVYVTLPTVDGKRHSWLASCTDSVTLRYDENRGRHLVATRDIRPGAVLIVDQPFSYSTDAPALDRNCLHCHATLKLEDSVRIPCRNCQTVSRRAHDLLFAHARVTYHSTI